MSHVFSKPSFSLSNIVTGRPQMELPEGALDGETEYTGRFTQSARAGTSRAKYAVQQDLITPYGNLAGSAVRLGDARRYNVASA